MSSIDYLLEESAMVVSTQALNRSRGGLKIYLSAQSLRMPTWVHVLAPSSKRDCISGDPIRGHVEEVSAKYETGVIVVII